MSDKLRGLIEANRSQFERALEEAQQELSQLNRRKAELELMVAGIRAALGGEAPPVAPPPGPLNLHEAIRRVLLDRGNRPMTVTEIAAEINARGLYTKRDGSQIGSSQIHARTSAYQDIFIKNGPNVRLKGV